MSRIGKVPVSIPAGVEVEHVDSVIRVVGPKGRLTQKISADIECVIRDGAVHISATSDSKKSKSAHGLYRMLVANMVTGVSQGFQKELLLQGVGYRAEIKDKLIVFSLGYSTQIEYHIPDGLEIAVDKRSLITIRGIDKQLVGQVAADIRSLRPPEPYKGKGIRYTDEFVRQKAGKAGVK